MEETSDPVIVVAVDFEHCSRSALQVARQITVEGGGQLVVVHILTGAMAGGAEGLSLRAAARGVLPDDLALSEATSRMERFLLDSGPSVAGERTRIEVGDAAEKIVSIAQEERAPTVVIGTHGRGRIGHALFGSVARDVMGRARCRVIAVHEPQPTGAP